MNETLTKTRTTELDDPSMDSVPRIGRTMTRMRMMTGRRLIGRLAIQSVAPDLELSHLDVLDAVRRAQANGEATSCGTGHRKKSTASRGCSRNSSAATRRSSFPATRIRRA